jgi:hypothetical protein
MKITLSHLRLLPVLILTLTTLTPVFAGNPYSGVRILIGVVPEKQGMESKIYAIIYNLLILEFERYGFLTEKIYPENGNPSELSLSAEHNAELVLICSYSTNDIRVSINTALYDVKTQMLVASAAVSSDVDLEFDSVIASTVSELMNGADEKLTEIVESLHSQRLVSDVEEDIPEEMAAAEVPTSHAHSKGGLEVLLDAGVAMGAGKSREFLKNPGISAGLSANYWFFTTIGLLGLGAQASANLYTHTGTTEQANLIMLPLGINLAYSTPAEKLFSFLLHVASGPAIAVLIFDEAEPLVKVLPYISGAASLSINFRKKMSLGLKMVYSIYFEETERLTTITPYLYVSFRSRG